MVTNTHLTDECDDEYAAIADKVTRAAPGYAPSTYVEALRRLAELGHVESMNLLAILLGDIDSSGHRSEIVELGTRSHDLGSPVAAETLSIQYRQWNEPLLAGIWMRKATDRAKEQS